MITIKKFGTLSDGCVVNAYTLHAPNKMKVTLLNYGATLQSFCLPSGHDIVLGFDHLDDYVAPHPYFGSAIGRVANRIKDGQFSIEGQDYQVAINEGNNTLHSGPKGFEAHFWEAELESSSIKFMHISPHGDQGYPGTLKTTFRYALDNEGLRLDMRAETSHPTPVNITGHSYFNLDGGVINDHALSLKADSYFETDDEGINLGDIKLLKDTIFDFRASRKIEDTSIDYHFNVPGTNLRKLATLFSPQGDKRLTLLSDLPGFQLYTGDFIGNRPGKAGQLYRNRSGIAFEPQYPPNAINLENMTDTILRPGQIWEHSIIYKIEERPLR